ncbi:hypothetical protein D3C75_892480 [compost metagenome]
MHDLGVGRGPGQLLAVQTPEAEILASRGDQGAGHALQLKAQHHDHVAAGQTFLHVVEDLAAPAIGVARHQGRRPDQAHTRAHHRQQGDVGAGHPAVGDVAADGHRQTADVAKGAAQAQQVQEGLRRVFVATVTGVDDGAADLLRQQVHGARRRMADHENLGLHRVQRHRRVDQGLALGDRGG